jgi:serine/threonine-protein kinase RsbW
MNSSDPGQILSRLPDEEFFDRQAELAQLYALARRGRRATSVLLLGAPRVGKTELLLKSFDRLFAEGAEVVPIYYAFRPYLLEAERFARDFLAQFLAQFIASRRSDPRLMAASDEPLAAIARAAPTEDYLWIRDMVDSFAGAAKAGALSAMVRAALSAPVVAASRAQLAPFVMIDNFHLLADEAGAGIAPSADRSVELRSEIIRTLAARTSPASLGGAEATFPSYALCGLRRPMIEIIPPDEELFGSLEMVRVEPMGEEPLERMIRSTAAKLKIEISDSTAELMIQQLNRDLFYTQALLDRAATTGAGLKTFMEFERIYTQEVLSGRIGHYLGALLRGVARSSRARRAALEALSLAVEARDPVPIEAVVERMGDYAADAEALLGRLHARELLEINYGFVHAPDDPVLADYVRATYRREVAGARRPIAGEELLSEKLKHSYRLMMSRYNRSVESQLVELLARFDFQSVPSSLFDEAAFEKRYRGMSRVQIRRALDEEAERLRLPQIVLVNDAGSGEQPGVSWRLFAASGFEGGIYSEANEVLWLIALINSKEPLDVETLGRIDQRLEATARAARERTGHPPRAVRWCISKEGFSAVAAARLASLRAHRSTYAQLDLLYDYLIKHSAGEAGRRPASEFELTIPIEDDAELIAARTVEQIARAADFEQEAINQIKTALIEACINAAEHSDSPDRRIYQRFAIDDDRLIITVSNKGRAFDLSNGGHGQPSGAATLKGTRGRGLQIIRALMDEVRFERTDDGASLVMIKRLKRPQNQ